MSEIETNIFRITNLKDLSSRYRTYRVVNLHKDQEDYYQNCQHITRILSFRMRSPVAVVEQNGEPILIVKDDAPAPPTDMFLVRTRVVFEPLAEKVELDYTVRSPENDAICIRFLSFLVQNPLRNHSNLWQPGSGQAFFERTPCEQGERLHLFRGHSVRPILTPTGGIGLCVDVVSKLVYKRPLPHSMDRQTFQRFKGSHCIYRFGKQWYEIILSDFIAFNVSQHKFHVNGQPVILYNYILDQCEKPLPPEIANLPKDSAVVMYGDNREEKRSAAAALPSHQTSRPPPLANDPNQAKRRVTVGRVRNVSFGSLGSGGGAPCGLHTQGILDCCQARLDFIAQAFGLLLNVLGGGSHVGHLACDVPNSRQ